MATPQEKLADALRALKELQEVGAQALRSSQLTRTHRERLLRNGFIREVMKGWYVASTPEEKEGDSTSWYSSYWPFCADYLQHRFGDDWVLAPEQSLALHTGNWTVPHQLLVRSGRGGNKPSELIFATSIFDLRLALPDEQDIVEIDGLRLYSLEAALVAVPKPYYAARPTDMRTALSMTSGHTGLLRRLLNGGHSKVAGRIAGAYRNIGATDAADDIVQSFRSAGYIISENDPFEDNVPVTFEARQTSPWVNRLKVFWNEVRETVIQHFPKPPHSRLSVSAYMKDVDDRYVLDAYNSLSIEGYRVTEELINKVASGDWRPDENESDREQANALAARGYWLAFQSVRKNVKQILQGDDPGMMAAKNHDAWYRELFAPAVAAGILEPGDLAGYRNRPVYIAGSRHTPPRYEALPDAMATYFKLLGNETHPAVRVVLGHFMFVYIHPYNDGNGRIGRFLMNLMCAGGTYPWTIVPLEQRTLYMEALEAASVEHDLLPFTRFIAELIGSGESA